MDYQYIEDCIERIENNLDDDPDFPVAYDKLKTLLERVIEDMKEDENDSQLAAT